MYKHQERQERSDPCQDDVVHGIQHFLLILKALLIGKILWQIERGNEDMTARLILFLPPLSFPPFLSPSLPIQSLSSRTLKVKTWCLAELLGLEVWLRDKAPHQHPSVRV